MLVTASFRHEWFNRLFGTARRSAIRHMWIAERSIIIFLHLEFADSCSILLSWTFLRRGGGGRHLL